VGLVRRILYYDSKTGRLYVATGGDGKLRLYDEKSLTVRETLEFGGDADNVRYDQQTGDIWVGYGIKWLLVQSMVPKTKMEGIITEDAFATLSEKLSTPLQFEFYLTRALEEAYKVGQKPVGADMIDNVLAKDINGLEPRLTREGYNVKVLAELLNAKPREIKEFLRGQLAPGRTQELQNELLAAGIPL
jgi:hypothetical protein